MSTQDKNKATFKRLFDEVVNTGRMELAEKFLTADRPDHQELGMPPELTKGHAGFARIVGSFCAAFPDLKFTSDFMVAEGDLVVSHNTVSGTHKGAFMGAPATGKSFRAQSLDVCRFNAEGMITEHWGVTDVAGIMMQLGLIPAPR